MIVKLLRALVCVFAIHFAYTTFHKEITNLLNYVYPSAMSSNTLQPKYSFKLNSGYDMPRLGLGTWLSKPGEVGQAVIDAYDIGYRHFDCAALYRNEAEIGNALKEIFSKKKVKREDLFITSKVWNTFHSYQKTGECLEKTLKDLQLDYLDMYLIHFPMGYAEGGSLHPQDANGKNVYSDIDYLETWKAMEDAVIAGKIRSIGISNFNKDQIERVIKNGRIKPSNLQIEIHPYFPQRDLIKFCHENGIAVTAYSPLANNANKLGRTKDSPNLLNEQRVVEIGRKHSKSPAQVVIRWALQRDTIVIPKSVKKNRLKENFDVFNFNLSDQEMKDIDNLDLNWRILALETTADHPYYPFHKSKL